jgi:predicted outer membrane repeat protein
VESREAGKAFAAAGRVRYTLLAPHRRSARRRPRAPRCRRQGACRPGRHDPGPRRPAHPPGRIDAAAPGDTVLAAPGTYTGPGNRDLGFGGKAITLRSEAGAAATIIDGEHVAFCFHPHEGETPAAAVEGFTIRHGSDGTTYGGGALLEGASPTFRSCTFTENTANQGGGIYGQGASAVFEGCAFTANTASNWGGGICCRYGATATLDRSSFTRNSSRTGGGMCSIESSAALDSCIFSHNTASYQGGGLYNDRGPSLVLTHCTFTGNSGPAQGGGGVFRWYGVTTTVTDPARKLAMKGER